MPVIDVHAHVWPHDVAPRAVDALIERSALTPYYNGTIDGLLAEMDRTGVDITVLQPVATRASQVESINTWTASIANERIIPFGAMHPDYPDPESEIERMVALGIRGIKLHPEFQDFQPTDPRMERTYRAASKHGLVMLFHAGEHPGYEEIKGVPNQFKTVLAQHPDLTVILAHLGGYQIWDEVAAHLLGERVYLDTAYTLAHLPKEDVAAIIRGHGHDRILFGSDGPWKDVKDELKLMSELGLDAEELEDILWRNTAKLLNLNVHSGILAR